jgi:hypothetical protein
MLSLLNLCAQENIEAKKTEFVEQLETLMIQFWNYFDDRVFTQYVSIQIPVLSSR